MEKKTARLLSLDALRGFDMFWITGGEELVHVMAKVLGWGWLVGLSIQLTHPAWNGLHAYDFIFPLFIFMAGVSTPFSFQSRIAKSAGRGLLMKKSITRGLILVVLGIVYNNGLFHTVASQMRYPSVLGRIGLAGMFGQLIYLFVPSRNRLIGIIFFILITYWLFLVYYPVPVCGAGHLTMECNPVSYFDNHFMPGRLHRKIHDPEGVLSTYPAIATSLLGILAGLILVDKRYTSIQKLIRLVLSGAICVVIGIIWNYFLPINKNLWTSSFTLVVGGGSFFILALFYWIIDILYIQRWTLFFKVIGMNSIVIYMLKKFVDIPFTSQALFGGLCNFLPRGYAEIGGVVAFILVQWALMYYLYKHKLFLKI